ncbi:MAG TPA: DUF485 domain-containing protein [Kribbella sp.]|nr:DUF485 domain-containing protein [Kribbella sp.]
MSSNIQQESDRLVGTQRSPEFQQLRRRFRSFVFPMTVAFLAWYLLYVIASGWARDFMGHKLVGNINVAYVFGLLQFVSTFLIAWLYERHMNKNVDPLAAKIRHELEGDVR